MERPPGTRDAPALILTWSHPSDTVSSLAALLAGGLARNGMDAAIVDIGDRPAADRLLAAPPDAYSMVVLLGTMPLRRKGGTRWVFEHFAAPIHLWVLDPVIYDFARVRETREFLDRARTDPRYGFLFPDRSYQRLLQEASGARCLYFPFAGHFADAAPPADGRSDAVLILANMGRELSRHAGFELEEILRQLDPFRLSRRERARLAEHVREDEASANVAHAVQAFLGLEPKRLFEEKVLRLLVALDASEKRRRRFATLRAVEAIRTDLHGSGWRDWLGHKRNFRYVDAQTSHRDLPALFARHRVLLDFAPNWDEGFNDRVVTALGAGCRVVTSRNAAVAELGAAAPLVSGYSMHHPAPAPAILQALAAPPPDPALREALRAEHGWARCVGPLLG